MAHEGTSSVAAPATLWRAGTLSIDDLDRLAGEIRPSWEVGLDAVDGGAPNAARAVTLVPATTGFAAAPARLVAEMDSVGTHAMSIPPFVAQQAPSPPTRPVSQRPPPPTPANVSRGPATAAAVRAAGYDEPVLVPQRGRAPMLYAAVAGGVALVALIGFLALRGASSTTAPTAETPSVASTAVVTPPAPALAVTPPSPIVPAPVAIAPQPTPSPAIAVVRTPPPTHSTTSAPVAAASHPRPRPVAAANPAPAQHPASTTHHPRGVGFVTSSPY